MISIRTILHIDLNSFYASVEVNENPSLKNIPIAVAGNESKRNGVILTACYNARTFGIKAGMSNRDALNLCPHLKLVPPRMSLYKKYSNDVMNIIREYSYKVEQFSIDEAWIDIGDIIKTSKDKYNIAFEVKERIKNELGVTVSIGISHNKVLAKLASDIAGRDSFYEITDKSFRETVWDRPVKELIGVGSKTYDKLKSLNIFTIKDLAMSDINLIKALLKKPGEVLWYHANGIDNSPVNFEKSFPKSVGISHTLKSDIESYDEAKNIMFLISEEVGEKLRKYKASATTVTITVKYNDFTSFTKRKTLSYSFSSTKRIYKEALNLLYESWDEQKPVRLLGITLSNIQYYEEQLSFYSYIDEEDIVQERIDNIIDLINNKHKKSITTRAFMLDLKKLYSRID